MTGGDIIVIPSNIELSNSIGKGKITVKNRITGSVGSGSISFFNKPIPRSKESYNKILDQFYMSSANERYSPVGGTKCNKFAYDLSVAMGVPFDLNGSAPNQSAKLANELFVWFKSAQGWRQVVPTVSNSVVIKTAAQNAQQRASTGYPTFAVWYNSSGHGHIAAVVPYKYAVAHASWPAADMAYIAQAGSAIYRYNGINYGFLPSMRTSIRFFTHD